MPRASPLQITAPALWRSADGEAILAALRRGPRPTDLLRRETGLERSTFLRALLELEIAHAVRRLPGDLWSTTGRTARTR